LSIPRRWSDLRLHWQKLLAWGGLSILSLFQFYTYGYRLDLSLGPRVILQPWLLRSGFIQYETAIDIHTPLMPFILALFQPLAPSGLFLAKLALIGLLSITLVLVFLIAGRHSGWLVGLGAATFFVLWSVTFGYPKLWHETFLAPLYMGVWLLYKPQAERTLIQRILAGFLCGLMVLVKQYGAVVAVAFLAWEIFTGLQLRRSLRKVLMDQIAFCLAAAAPVVVYIVWQAWTAGTLSGLWYWTVVYPLTSDYRDEVSQAITNAQALILVIAGLFLPAAAAAGLELRRRGDARWLWFGCGFILLVSASLTAYPRFNFFHLQPVLPLAGVLTAVTLGHNIKLNGLARVFMSTTAVAALLAWILCAAPSYQALVEAQQPRTILEYSPLVPLANAYRQSVGPEKCFFIFGDDEALSNLYYLTGCLPPRYWIFQYTWYMIPPVQQALLSSIRSSPPDYVFYFPGRNNIEKTAPEVLAYIQSNYSDTGKLDWSVGEVRLLKHRP
jgi:hypothetical protein